MNLKELQQSARDGYIEKFGLCRDGEKCQCKEELRFIDKHISLTYSLAHEELIEKVKEIKRLLGEPSCEYLHHTPSDYHKSEDECPVVKKINELLTPKE